MFDVGDKVVYPHHGAALITKRVTKKIDGEKVDYLVLTMTQHDLTLSVPAANVEQVGMRPPIGADEVEGLIGVLERRDVREPSNWSRRFKNHEEKLKSGDAYQVAEVVRNLALRNQARGLSAGEKTLYKKAHVFLVSELGFAMDVEEDEAAERIAVAVAAVAA
jgi:CarD family transcriptional regulator